MVQIPVINFGVLLPLFLHFEQPTALEWSPYPQEKIFRISLESLQQLTQPNVSPEVEEDTSPRAISAYNVNNSVVL